MVEVLPSSPSMWLSASSEASIFHVAVLEVLNIWGRGTDT